MKKNRQYFEIFQEEHTARERRTLRQFAEESIILPTGPRKGMRFSIEYSPMAGCLLDAVVNAEGKYRIFAAAGPTQTGKTVILETIPMAYDVFERRIDTGFLAPTLEDGWRVWSKKIRPVIKATEYKELLPVHGAGSKGGQTDNMTLKNGVYVRFFGAGGSDAQRSSDTVERLYVTEADKMDSPGDVSKEADPITQGIARTSAFGDKSLAIVECTPSVEDGYIWQAVTVKGSDGRIFIRCPHCWKWIYPERENFVGWQDAENVVDAGLKARYACQECGVLWDEKDRALANRYPVIVHAAEPYTEERARKYQTVSDTGKVQGPEPYTWTNIFGVRWNWMHANSKMISMRQVGELEWEAARTAEGSKHKDLREQALCQFKWALPYDDTAETRRLSNKLVNSKEADYPRGGVPDGVEFLIGSIDVQKRWCYWTVYGYNKDMTRWFIDYGIEKFVDDGDLSEPTEEQVRAGLNKADAFMCNEYNVALRGIDISYKREGNVRSVVRDWARERGVYSIMGRTTGQLRKMAKTGERLKLPVGMEYLDPRRQPSGEIIWFFDVNILKGYFHGSFFIPQGEPGSIYVFKDIKRWSIYARHITAEHQETTFEPGKGYVTKWVQTNKRNDLLDCSAYNDGLARLYAKLGATNRPVQPQYQEKQEQPARGYAASKNNSWSIGR